MCDHDKSSIDNDLRMPYYSEIKKWNVKYAAYMGVFLVHMVVTTKLQALKS
jgi:hypothetical protein